MASFLVCDDHALVRDALKGMIELGWPDATIETAGDFSEARSKAGLGHDLIVCDLVMPGSEPIPGIDGVLEAAGDTPVMILTGTESDALLLELLDRGVAGFASKTASGSIIRAAMELILAGGRYLPPRLAELAAARFVEGPARLPGAGEAPGLADRLTDRQIDVLRLLAKGYSNKEIGRALAIAPSTVKSHISHVLECLGAANRTEAAIKAKQFDL